MNELPYIHENGHTRQMTEDEYSLHLSSLSMHTPLVPSSVSMRQFRLALIETRKVTLFTDAIKSILDATEKAKVQIEWDYNPIVDRNASWFLTLLGQADLTDEEIDSIFIKASSL